jgi:hypothetical protein
MHAAPFIPFIKPTLDALKRGLAIARGSINRRKYEQLVSATITELLKEYPDLTAAEAQLAAIRATGVEPDTSLFRAQEMLTSARHHRRRSMRASARARWAKARKVPAKRKKKPQKRVTRKRSLRAKRKA